LSNTSFLYILVARIVYAFSSHAYLACCYVLDIPVWRGYFLFGTLLDCIWTSYPFPVVVCVHVCVLGRVPVCVYGRACICTCTLVCSPVVVHGMLECIMMYAGLWCWMLA